MTTSRFCAYCGAILPLNVKFCANCGQSIDAATAPARPAPGAFAPPPPPPPPPPPLGGYEAPPPAPAGPPRSGSMNPLLIGGAIAVIAVVAFLVFGQKDDEKSPGSGSSGGSTTSGSGSGSSTNSGPGVQCTLGGSCTGGSTAPTSVPSASGPAVGTYQFNGKFSAVDGWQPTLTSIEVLPNRTMKVNILYTATSGVKPIFCPSTPRDADTTVKFDNNVQVFATDTFCKSRRGESFSREFQSYGIFPVPPTASTTFEVTWYDWGTVNGLRLSR